MGKRRRAGGWSFCRKTQRQAVIVMAAALVCSFLPKTSLAGTRPDNLESLDGLIWHLYRDTGHVLTSPLRWGQDDLLFLATISVGTVVLMTSDTDSRHLVQRNRSHAMDDLATWTNKYTKRVATVTIGGLYVSGLILDNRKARETALLCLESVALAEGITTGLKYLVGRSRPFADKGAFDFNPLKSSPPPYSLSFPSGHATTAFALSSVVAEQYGGWLVKLAAYGFALAVSYGRLNVDVHFLSDVFWGGIIGISVGRCLVRFHRKDNLRRWTITSAGGPANPGLGFTIALR
jgi:membrane-associated phospholipid phosphatase